MRDFGEDRWRDSYDDWKTRGPDDDEERDEREECDDCGAYAGDEHSPDCIYRPPLPPLSKRMKAGLLRGLWRVYYWQPPSIWMLHNRALWKWRKLFPKKPVIDDDLPF